MIESSFTLMHPDTHQCPYDRYRRLRTEAPVFFDQTLRIFVVSRYQLIQQITSDPGLFSNEPDPGVQAIFTNDPEVLDIYRRKGGYPPFMTLAVTDPPVHRRYRTLVEAALGAANVKELETRITARVDAILDRFIGRERADFQREFSLELPVSILADLFGIAHDHLEIMRAMADATVRTNDGTAITRAELIESHTTQIRGQLFFQPYIESYRRSPRDNFLSHLVNARLDGEAPLTDQEIHSVVQVLLVGGNDTTPAALSNTLLQLIKQPDYQERLRGNAGLIARFVEESLRLESPVQGLYRRATRDTELAGVKIPKGSMLNLRYGAANRDESTYEHANELDLDRKGVRNHLAFGSGIHYCAGSILARTEVNTMVMRVLARMRDIRLNPPEFTVRYVEKLAVRNPVELPIAFTVAPSQ